MFSLLNTKIGKGREPAKVCKILDSLSVFFDSIWEAVAGPFYLLESQGFRSKIFLRGGHQIALLVRQRVWVRIQDGRS